MNILEMCMGIAIGFLPYGLGFLIGHIIIYLQSSMREWVIEVALWFAVGWLLGHIISKIT